jgi:hypothetical protein
MLWSRLKLSTETILLSITLILVKQFEAGISTNGNNLAPNDKQQNPSVRYGIWGKINRNNSELQGNNIGMSVK